MKIGNIADLAALAPEFAKILPKTSSFKTSQVPGVYCLKYSDRFYIGMSTNLEARLNWHLAASRGEVTRGGGVSQKYWSVVKRSKKLPEIYILEHGDSCKNSIIRNGLERMWILLFWKKFRSNMINTMFVPDLQLKKKSQKLDKVERLARSIRMSETIRQAHKDPIYKKKMRAIAEENWRSVPEEKRKQLNANFGKRMKTYFEDPSHREAQSKNVLKQWRDPKFQQANLDRLQRLHASGWKPAPIAVLKIELPDGTKHLLLKTDLSNTLKLGGRYGGVDSIFTENYLFSDWKVKCIGTISGRLRQSRQQEFDENLRAFKDNQFVSWIVRSKEKNEKFFVSQPVRFELNGSPYRASRIGLAKRAGKFLIQGLTSMQKYESLYAFATDRVPLWK